MKRNLLWSVRALMLAATLSLGFSACSSSDDEDGLDSNTIVGSWRPADLKGEIMHAYSSMDTRLSAFYFFRVFEYRSNNTVRITGYYATAVGQQTWPSSEPLTVVKTETLDGIRIEWRSESFGEHVYANEGSTYYITDGTGYEIHNFSNGTLTHGGLTYEKFSGDVFNYGSGSSSSGNSPASASPATGWYITGNLQNYCEGIIRNLHTGAELRNYEFWKEGGLTAIHVINGRSARMGWDLVDTSRPSNSTIYATKSYSVESSSVTLYYYCDDEGMDLLDLTVNSNSSVNIGKNRYTYSDKTLTASDGTQFHWIK